MNYLTVEKISKTFGEKLLFHQITFGIEKGQKTALIAKNGTGKSTLLNIIAGVESADEGQVVVRKDITVSYLPQMDNFNDDISVIDALFDAQTPDVLAVKEYESCLALVEAAEQTGTTSEALQTRLHHAIENIDRLNAWDFESKIKEILSRFGIHDIFKSIGTLSGGQRKKAALARTLIANTDLLILDEPTNHLDIDMIEWLEGYLAQANIALLMVTHDRHFLDQVCNDILELENGKLYHYRGKYDYYLEKKAERITNENAEHEKLKSLFQKELEWVHTSPQARTSKAKARIQAFETLKDAVSQKIEQPAQSFHVQPERLGNKILEINNLDFSYPNQKLIEDFSYIFKKGEKCGVLGKNGTGKSTFLKLIMGIIQPDAGKITAGQTIQFGYFSQEGLQVKGNKRIIDIVKEHAEVIRTETGNYIGASQFLNHFGFKYEQQYTYYDDLSGGEKRKLHLLITLMRNPNFLILDEPTNDFDIDTLNRLEDLLYHYKGCLLIVSHDRWFMNKLVDHIFVFNGDGKIKDFYGNYTDYKLEKEKQLRIEKKAEKLQRENSLPKEGRERRKSNEQKLTYKERIEFEQLTSEIEALEAEKKELIALMDGGSGDGQQLVEWSERYQSIETALDEKSMRWLILSEKE